LPAPEEAATRRRLFLQTFGLLGDVLARHPDWVEEPEFRKLLGKLVEWLRGMAEE
jgi:hypothetical protein